MPRFSIIAVDYDQHVDRNNMRRGLRSIAAQTFRDFELIICHDGPKEIPYAKEFDFEAAGLQHKPLFMELMNRANDWGHTCRDTAMRLANGEWFLHFNIDNLLYPRALERIDQCIRQHAEWLVIFSIWHRKLRMPKLTGIPPSQGQIDALQLVAHRDVWKEFRYWYDRCPHSDGIIYEAMCKKYPYARIDEVIAENF